MPDIAIRIENVSKEYRLGAIGGTTLREEASRFVDKLLHRTPANPDIGKKFMALQDINLEVKKGERLGIIGHNGAGKSTLLKLLARVTAPTTGTISYNGRISSMLEVGTGFHRELTGRENIYMNGAILGMTKKEIDSKIDQIIDFAEMEQFIDTPVKRYSSGMYVKLAFAVAAHLDNEILIMDEVLAVGDVNFQQKCLKKMRESAMIEGKTILYVSHNMETIKKLCTRCIVLRKGELIFNGNNDEAIEIYIEKDSLELKKEYEMTKLKRPEGVTGKCKLIKCNIHNNILDENENLEFSLEIESGEEMNNIRLRMVVLNDIENPIGMVYSNEFKLGKRKSVKNIIFKTQVLSPGKYKANLIICEYTGNQQIRHDVATPAFTFEIQEKKHLLNMKWDQRSWGNINFEDMIIK